MPQRALLRLKRAGIDLYDVKKTQKNQILFSVSAKDSEKVFAIYPNVCYNISVYSPFTVKKVDKEGLARWQEKAKRRIGLLLGALLFAVTLFAADEFVFAVELTGASVYAREAKIALENVGITPFSRFRADKTDLVCAQLLALEDVEFCSVKKHGFYVQVEIRSSSFAKLRLQTGALKSSHRGTLLALTVLKGEPMKKIGDAVEVGETLVAERLVAESGGQVCVEVVARAQIACVYEGDFDTETEEEALASAYLELSLSDRDKVVRIEAVRKGNAFHVKAEYVVWLAMNLG